MVQRQRVPVNPNLRAASAATEYWFADTSSQSTATRDAWGTAAFRSSRRFPRELDLLHDHPRDVPTGMGQRGDVPQRDGIVARRP